MSNKTISVLFMLSEDEKLILEEKYMIPDKNEKRIVEMQKQINEIMVQMQKMQNTINMLQSILFLENKSDTAVVRPIDRNKDKAEKPVPLEDYTLSDAAGFIADKAERSRLTNVRIKDGVTSIGEKAFYGCSKINSVIIPDSVMNIGDWAFRDCRNLTSVSIGSGVTNIGNWAFKSCKSLTSITIPDSVTNIGICAFEKCTSLTSVIIPDNVTSIGDCAFEYCENLTSVDIGNNVINIGYKAFRNCPNLTTVNIPDNVIEIVGDTFWNYPKIKRLPVFGYIVDGTQLNFEKVQALDVEIMLNEKYYDIEMDYPTMYQFVTQVFLKTGQPEAEEYILKNITNILTYFIYLNDYYTVEGLLESGRFVNKKNIRIFIDYATEYCSNTGDMKMLMLFKNYKNNMGLKS